jgi:hypothetical protein
MGFTDDVHSLDLLARYRNSLPDVIHHLLR